MTEKQIKKAIELAEGFECKIELDREIVEYKNRYYTLKDLYKWEYYPLLLYRAVEKFNENHVDLGINIYDDCVLYFGHDDETYYYYKKNYISTPYLTAQEQALEAALEEVL